MRVESRLANSQQGLTADEQNRLKKKIELEHLEEQVRFYIQQGLEYLQQNNDCDKVTEQEMLDALESAKNGNQDDVQFLKNTFIYLDPTR